MPRPYIDDRRRKSGPFGGLKKAVQVIAVGGVLFAVVSIMIRESRQADPVTVSVGKSTTRMSPRALQDHAALNGLAGGAAAGQKVLNVNRAVAVAAVAEVEEPTPADPRPLSGKAIRLTQIVSAVPHQTKDEAVADAIEVARRKLGEKLAQLDPPIDRLPSAAAVRAHYLRADSVTEIQPTPEVRKEWDDNKLNSNRLWVSLDVEVSDAQVREMRAAGRVAGACWAAAALFAVALAGWGFFKLDAATKGYLTAPLGLAAIAVAVGAVAAAVLMR